MPFAPGVGVADFLIVAKLASKAIRELKEIGEAAPRYQNLLVELEALSRALSCINTIQPEAQELVHLEAIRATASACKRPLEDFLSKIQKYDKSLGSWDAKEKRFRGVGRRVQFNLALEEDVKELRAILTNHASTINMLLLLQVLSSVSLGGQEQSTRDRELTKDMTSLRDMMEEEKGRYASQLRDQEKPAESMPKEPNPTESAFSIAQKQSTSPTSETSLQPGNDPDSQGKTSDVRSSSSDLPESKMPSDLPSAKAVLDMGSRVLGIGLSISALISMHGKSFKPAQNRANPAYRVPLVPDLASVGLYSAAPSSSLGTSSISNISTSSNISHDSNQLRPSIATDPLSLRVPESNTPATSGQGGSEGSDDLGQASCKENISQNQFTSKASLQRKRPGPEGESRIDTSSKPEVFQWGSGGGGGMPMKARLSPSFMHRQLARSNCAGLRMGELRLEGHE